MRGDNPDPGQSSFLAKDLPSLLNPRHPLYRLADTIPWQHFDDAFGPLYSKIGRPGHPVRLMVGLLILKHVEDLSDERVVERWVENPYYQYFCGETHFRWEFPCHPTDLVRFRQRIGTEGIEEILKVSVQVQAPKEQRSDAVVLDTTVQEKAIMAPHDSKLYRRVLVTCVRIAHREGIALRRTYAKEARSLVLGLRTRNFRRARKKARRLTKRLRTIAGKVYRDLRRKCNETQRLAYAETFATMERILAQRPADKGKVYSLHEPQIYCMGKGKDHKQWEFGTKVSIAINGSGVVVGAMNLARNAYDGHTVEDALEQVQRLTGQLVRVVVGDQGYRGAEVDPTTRVVNPADLLRRRPRLEGIERRWVQKLCRWRPTIEPIIGHLKSDHRLGRNFLKGWFGDEINVMLAAAGFNFRRLLRKFYALISAVVECCLDLSKALAAILRLGRLRLPIARGDRQHWGIGLAGAA